MSILTSPDAAALLETVLINTIDLYSVGPVVTTGINTSRAVERVANGLPALVQNTTLENAVESQTSSVYSIKVARGTVISAGMMVEVVSCEQEPELEGKRLLLDKVSKNGAALLRKCVASDFEVVNQEGKEGL